MTKTPRELAAMLAELGHQERAVAELLITRLHRGRDAYGEWQGRQDNRDFHHESLEEVADLAIYLTMAVHRLGDERPAPAPAPEVEVDEVDPPEVWPDATPKPTNGEHR